MVGAWEDVQQIVEDIMGQNPQIVIARLLLAMRKGDRDLISQRASDARLVLGAPISAAGARGYRRSYDAVLNLHLTHELEIIYDAMTGLSASQSNSQTRRRQVLAQISDSLSSRLDSTLPTFRTREPILSMRRTAFGLACVMFQLTPLSSLPSS